MIAWTLAILALVLNALTIVLRVANGSDLITFVTDQGLLSLTIALTFSVTGALVASRYPRNAIGWILLLTPLCEALSGALGEYGRYGLLTSPASDLPGEVIASWVANWVWLPGFGVFIVYLALLFPDGHAPTPRWRWAGWLGGIGLSVAIAALAAGQWPHRGVMMYEDLPSEVLGPAETVFGAGVGIAIGAAFLSLGALARRFRRSSGIERQQIKWVLFAASLAMMTVGASFVLGSQVASLLQAFTVPMVGVAIGTAILRYRLYEIDRIISRTATYVLVTAVLAILYVLVAVVPAVIFDLNSDILVAVATLTAAAAFVPVRRRAQEVVDRRFNRSRYDARQVADSFAVRLRDEVHLDTLVGDLGGVVAATVQPTAVTVWLRPGRGRA